MEALPASKFVHSCKLLQALPFNVFFRATSPVISIAWTDNLIPGTGSLIAAAILTAAMPSFIYIARIRSLSEELAQSLRSAGCHVESFKPGDITEDECLLAMTSEALAGSLHPEGDGAEIDTKAGGVPATPKTNAQLGSQSAIWNSIKAAASKDSHPNVEPVMPVGGPATSNAPAASNAIEHGFTPTEVGRRALANAQAKSRAEVARIEPSPEPSHIMAAPSAEASRDSEKHRHRIKIKEQCFRIMRNPLSTVVALLVFAVVYRGVVPSTTSAGSVRKANDYTQSNPDSTDSLLRVSGSPEPTAHRLTRARTAASAEAPQAAERVRRFSDDGFVAPDFTNRLAAPIVRPTQSGATAQHNPELKPSPSDAKRKRIVVD